MIKIINFFIPFLLEMLFGKKEKKEEETKIHSKFKKGFVYVLMMLSFSFNYFSINKIYTVSLKYVTLSKQNIILQDKIQDIENVKSRAKQLEESLQFCISNTYNPKKDTGKNKIDR